MADQRTATAATSGTNQTPAGSWEPSSAVPANPPQEELIPALLPEDDDDDEDTDSSLGVQDGESSTASVASSILNYRTIQGRTFHSERYNTDYFTPIDDQQQESVDITHHYLMLMLDGRLFLAPIKDGVRKVLDIGTGTGIWAIDFADQFPNAEVIGTDLSPIQPTWVPPNLKFELDDATQTWSWADNTFDFIHMRYLLGAIADWDELLAQAYRCCQPGGWVESCEVDVLFVSDDGTVDNVPGLDVWNKLYEEGGKKGGRTFCVVAEDIQRKSMEAAGFTDIQTVNYKLPIGGWPQDQKLREAGQFSKLTLENDLEGYTLLMWHNIMGWPKEEYQIFLMNVRKALKNKRIHAYMKLRYVYGRKP